MPEKRFFISSLRNKIRRQAGPAAIGALAMALAGCSADALPDTPSPRTVWVEAVRPADDAGARFAGSLQAKDRSDLAFEIGGLVIAIHVELGDSVKQGQLLAELDDRSVGLDLASREADLANAKAALVDARLGYRRRVGLAGTGAVSQSSIDQAKAAFDSATAQVEALTAAVELARKRLADTRLLAPFAGEITARLAEPSEVLPAGRQILRLIDREAGLEAVVHVPGTTRGGLAVGQRAELHRPAAMAAIPGRVTEIGAEANGAGLFPVTLEIDSTEASLRPGESVEARFPGEPGNAALRIPLAAYVPAGDRGATVYVVDGTDASRHVTARAVRLGAFGDESVEIVEGLAPGDTIVVRGADLLRDGEPVRVAGPGLGLARYNH